MKPKIIQVDFYPNGKVIKYYDNGMSIIEWHEVHKETIQDRLEKRKKMYPDYDPTYETHKTRPTEVMEFLGELPRGSIVQYDFIKDREVNSKCLQVYEMKNRFRVTDHFYIVIEIYRKASNVIHLTIKKEDQQ